MPSPRYGNPSVPAASAGWKVIPGIDTRQVVGSPVHERARAAGGALERLVVMDDDHAIA